MRRLAEDLELLDGFPPFSVNIYVMGGVLVDSGTRFAFRRIVRQLRGRSLTAHALTHAHPDHQAPATRSASCSDCRCGAVQPTPWRWKRQARSWPGCRPTGSVPPLVRTGSVPRTRARRLREGDEVGGFRVPETPVIRSVMSRSVRAGPGGRPGRRPGEHGNRVRRPDCEPQRIFSLDPARNRRSASRLVELQPRLTCFGHGPPLRDPQRLLKFVSRFHQSGEPAS